MNERSEMNCISRLVSRITGGKLLRTYHILSTQTQVDASVSPSGNEYKTYRMVWSGQTPITAKSEHEAYEIHKKRYPNRTINGNYTFSD